MNKKITQSVQDVHIPQTAQTKTHTASMEQASIPFNKLKLAERNVRSKIDKTTIEQLADDILNRGGLLQNLVTYRELDAQGNHTGFYKVFMGGRRWRALKFNVKRKAMNGPGVKRRCSLIMAISTVLSSCPIRQGLTQTKKMPCLTQLPMN